MKGLSIARRRQAAAAATAAARGAATGMQAPAVALARRLMAACERVGVPAGLVGMKATTEEAQVRRRAAAR